MREIMISIQPQWVEKILNKEKTIEIRKTKPNCELPCRVYIYCTKSKTKYLRKLEAYNKTTFITENKDVIGQTDKVKSILGEYATFCESGGFNGRVVAEFTLNEVKDYGYVYSPALLMQGYYTKRGKELDYSKCCLKLHEIEQYADDGKILPKPIFAWFIDDLKIYDKSKELSEFYKNNYKKIIDELEFNGCDEKHCKYAVGNSFIGDDGYCDYSGCPKLKLQKPPQSWCYVKEVSNG